MVNGLAIAVLLCGSIVPAFAQSKKKIAKADIWKAREWSLAADQKLTPVVVAIWDTGIDMTIFKDQQFVNAREQINGKDDDHNGFIDDMHGIGYDLGLNKDPNLLIPIKEIQARLPLLKRHLKGIFDEAEDIASPEAAEWKKLLPVLRPEELRQLGEDVNLYKDYIHGTQVASIVAEGNPFTRLLSARITWDTRSPPAAPTAEKARKEAKMYHEAVDYFKANQVRVVNISWGESRKDIENSLEHSGTEPDAARRAALARELFEIKRAGLLTALTIAPEILFVCGAVSGLQGEFQDLMPSSFALPNLISVGAVDLAGDRTSFTSVGGNVQVYANGLYVEGYVPGGDRLKASGPFMAAPPVANLAAKLFAVKPSLKPQEVVTLIQQGAEKGGSENLPLIHPKKTGELVKK